MSVMYRSMYSKKCLVVFLVLAAVEVNSVFFSVTRGLSHAGSNILEDVFKLPSSLCDTTDPECSRFSGNVRSASKCLCECSRDKATFVVKNGQLRCTQNTLVRNPAGCNYKFRGTTEIFDQNAPLEVVSDHYFKYLSPLRKAPLWSCTTVSSSSAYQDCGQNWLPSPNGWGLFNISVPTGVSFFRFKLNPDPTNSYAHFKGKIVKLSLRCTKAGGYVDESCLLFKVKGTVNCNFNLPQPSVTSVMPTSSAVTTKIKQSTAMEPTTEFTEEDSNTPAITEATVSTLFAMDNASMIVQRSSPPDDIPTTAEEEVHGGGVATTEGTITEGVVKIIKSSESSNSTYVAIGSVLAAAVVVLSLLLVITCRRNPDKFSFAKCWKPSAGKDKENRNQANVQMTAVYDDMNYMMPVERVPHVSNIGQRKGFANPTYERGRDNTVKIRTSRNGGNLQRDPSNRYTDADFLSAPLPPIPSNSLENPGPSPNLRQNGQEDYEFLASQSEEDRVYQSVDTFGTKRKGLETSGQNSSKPGSCSPYQSSSICRGQNLSLDTKNENVNSHIQDNLLSPNSPNRLLLDPQEATYQALNSPPASPTSPSNEYQPLVKVQSEAQ